MASNEFDVDRIISWVELHGFERVALQFPDDLLATAPREVARLQKALPGRKLFVLGDSVYGSSTVNEVGALHYGADCIVHVGPSDQERTGSLPVLFLFGCDVLAAESTASNALAAALRAAEAAAAILLCDVALQHAIGQLADALGTTFQGPENSILIAEPEREVDAGQDQLPRWQDWRFGTLAVSAAWWASIGTLTLAGAAKPEPFRVCGRLLRGGSDGEEPRRCLPSCCGFIYVGSPGSATERSLLLRYGQAHPVWRLDPTSGDVSRLSSNALLMQRYRFVELARSAEVIGLLLCTTGAVVSQALADRLETLLRRAGRRVYRFVVGRISTDKLGNFPGIECYVSLAGPEHFPWDVRDFMTPVASPYEVEVALGAREWTGDYITDLEELLRAPLPIGPIGDSALAVQTLGASARVRHFSGGVGHEIPLSSALAAAVNAQNAASASAAHSEEGPRPAELEAGLHGVPSRYEGESTAPLLPRLKDGSVD